MIKLISKLKSIRVCLVGWVEKWEDKKLGRDRKVRQWKRFIIFSQMYLIGRMEKWRKEKHNYLFEKKNERMENVIQINLLSCPIR